MFYVVWTCITETDYLKEDGVVAPKHVVENLVGLGGVPSDTDVTEFTEEKK
jgi:hypothetical protein